MTLYFLVALVYALMGIFWVVTNPKKSARKLSWYLTPRNLIYSSALIITLTAQNVFYDQLSWSIISYDLFFQILGMVVFSIGVAFAVWAKITMGKNWGMPGVLDKEQAGLVSAGPFKISRNPIYVGLFLTLLGFTLALTSYLVVLVIPLALFFYKTSIKEEKLLRNRFGDEYMVYKKKVPRFLFWI